MSTKVCMSCGQSFLTDPRVNNHTFCSAPECQEERRKQWRQNKMLTDPDYWRAYRSKTTAQLAPLHFCFTGVGNAALEHLNDNHFKSTRAPAPTSPIATDEVKTGPESTSQNIVRSRPMQPEESKNGVPNPSAQFRAAEYVRMSTEHQQYSTENQADGWRCSS